MNEERKIRARKIPLQISPKMVREDLERYRKAAMQYGATDARIIEAGAINIDERVRIKCAVPRCHLYGETPNCPPYTPEPEVVRKVVEKYKYAILFKNDVEPKKDFLDDKEWHRRHMAHQGQTGEIAGLLEADAFNDGYYFALGFGAGGCKTALCRGQICQFLDSGRCRFPLKSRPSMEGVGIDVFGLVTSMGWEVYPIAHRHVDPDSIPCAISVGIVLIC